MSSRKDQSKINATVIKVLKTNSLGECLVSENERCIPKLGQKASFQTERRFITRCIKKKDKSEDQRVAKSIK